MKVFAHRGASSDYAEHTRAAFAHALALGVDGIETDVQLSADGHLICWHDSTLDRTSSGTGPVRAHRLTELRKLDVHSWKRSGLPNPAQLPSAYNSPEGQLVTLDQLAQMMLDAGYEVELAVEMKIDPCSDGAIEDAVLEWLQRWEWNAATGTLMPNGHPTEVSVSIMSFSSDALRRVACLIPPSRLCALFDEDSEDFVDAELVGPSVRWLADAGSLHTWIRAGLMVRMWAVETDSQLHAARRLGVQQVTVNDPSWALQLDNAAPLSLLHGVSGR